MFGIPFLTALAMSAKVERALLGSARAAEPPVAGRAQIGAQLQAIRDELCELETLGRDLAELEQILDDACARIEEWTT